MKCFISLDKGDINFIFGTLVLPTCIFALIDKFSGGPVGIESLSVAISEDPITVEEVYEPYLIKEGYLKRTTRGRTALEKTYKYLIQYSMFLSSY